MTRLLVIALSVLTLARPGSAGTLTRMLERVPEGASLIVVIPEVNRFANGVSSFGERAGLPKLRTINAEQLLTRLTVFETCEGIQLDGPLVFALLPGHDMPLTLCCASPGDGWKKAISASSPDETDVYTVERYGPFGGALVTDGILALGDRRDIKRVRENDGKGMAPRLAAATSLQEHDATLFIDVAEWRAPISAVFARVRASIQLGMAMSGQHDPASQAMFNWILDQAQVLVAEAETYTVGISISADGIHTRDRTTLAPGGTIAQYIKHVEPTRRDCLRGLIPGDVVLAVGVEWNIPPGVEPWTQCWLDAMIRETDVANKRSEERFQRGLQDMATMYRKLSGYNFCMRTNPQGTGLVFDGLYFADDSQSILKGVAASYEVTPELMGGFGGSMKISRIDQPFDDLPVQCFRMNIDLDDEQARRMMTAMYGEDMIMCVAPHQAGAVYTMGDLSVTRPRLAAMLRDSGPALSTDPRVIAARSHLTPDPAALVLLDIPQFLRTVVGMMKSLGLPMPPIEVSDVDAPLVAYGFYIGKDEFRSELVIPTEPVRLIMSAARAAKPPRPAPAPRPPEPPKPTPP